MHHQTEQNTAASGGRVFSPFYFHYFRPRARNFPGHVANFPAGAEDEEYPARRSGSGGVIGLLSLSDRHAGCGTESGDRLGLGVSSS